MKYKQLEASDRLDDSNKDIDDVDVHTPLLKVEEDYHIQHVDITISSSIKSIEAIQEEIVVRLINLFVQFNSIYIHKLYKIFICSKIYNECFKLLYII